METTRLSLFQRYESEDAIARLRARGLAILNAVLSVLAGVYLISDHGSTGTALTLQIALGPFVAAQLTSTLLVAMGRAKLAFHVALLSLHAVTLIGFYSVDPQRSAYALVFLPALMGLVVALGDTRGIVLYGIFNALLLLSMTRFTERFAHLPPELTGFVEQSALFALIMLTTSCFLVIRAFEKTRASLDEKRAELETGLGTSQRLLSRVKELGALTQQSIAEYSAFGDQLSRGSTEQSAALTEHEIALRDLSEKAQEVDARSDRIAREAGGARSLIRETKAHMDQTHHNLQEVVEHTDVMQNRVQELLKAAETIGKAMTQIELIGFQSKLLAVNASIQAARAGEAGRGFRLVASEVKDLAAQSRSAADLVQQQLHQIGIAVGQTHQSIREGRKTASATLQLSSQTQSILARAVEAVVEMLTAAQDIMAIVEQQSRHAEEALASTSVLTVHAQELARGHGDLSQCLAKIRETADELERHVQA